MTPLINGNPKFMAYGNPAVTLRGMQQPDPAIKKSVTVNIYRCRKAVSIIKYNGRRILLRREYD